MIKKYFLLIGFASLFEPIDFQIKRYKEIASQEQPMEPEPVKLQMYITARTCPNYIEDVFTLSDTKTQGFYFDKMLISSCHECSFEKKLIRGPPLLCVKQIKYYKLTVLSVAFFY